VKAIFWVLGVPLGLILLGSLLATLSGEGLIAPGQWIEIMAFIGHPFIALLIATLLAIYFLGSQRGLSKNELFEVANKSLAPAGSIILITGAGGVLKTMMINTGIGDMIGSAMAQSSFSVVLLAYLVAALVRVMQGSATVAMLTAAGIVAAIIPDLDLGMIDKTLVMMAIAAGSVVASHVNDSGFWLVNRYLEQSVQESIKSWTIQSTMISVSSFLLIFIIYQLV
jgi:H+/gluconate symporter-like permease